MYIAILQTLLKEFLEILDSFRTGLTRALDGHDQNRAGIELNQTDIVKMYVILARQSLAGDLLCLLEQGHRWGQLDMTYLAIEVQIGADIGRAGCANNLRDLATHEELHWSPELRRKMLFDYLHRLWLENLRGIHGSDNAHPLRCGIELHVGQGGIGQVSELFVKHAVDYPIHAQIIEQSEEKVAS
ncbi:hypothetical protein D3C86_1655980 [compost metagenome]